MISDFLSLPFLILCSNMHCTKQTNKTQSSIQNHLLLLLLLLLTYCCCCLVFSVKNVQSSLPDIAFSISFIDFCAKDCEIRTSPTWSDSLCFAILFTLICNGFGLWSMPKNTRTHSPYCHSTQQHSIDYTFQHRRLHESISIVLKCFFRIKYIHADDRALNETLHKTHVCKFNLHSLFLLLLFCSLSLRYNTQHTCNQFSSAFIFHLSYKSTLKAQCYRKTTLRFKSKQNACHNEIEKVRFR